MVKRGRIDDTIPKRSRKELFLDYMKVLAHAPDYTLRQAELGRRARNNSGEQFKAFEEFGTKRGYIRVERKGNKYKGITLLEKGVNLVGDVEKIEKKYGFHFPSVLSPAVRVLEDE